VKVIWTRPAVRDLDAISEYISEYYISEYNVGAALRIVRVIRQQVCELTRSPYIGRPGRVEGTRELVVSSTSYIVPYRVHVEVLSVLHGARKWPDSFN
jgi:toxin ParE1/3/4